MLFLSIYVNLRKIAIGAGVFFLVPVFSTGLKWEVPPWGWLRGLRGSIVLCRICLQKYFEPIVAAHCTAFLQF